MSSLISGFYLPNAHQEVQRMMMMHKMDIS